MPEKPTSTPTWAANGNSIEPSDSKKSTGWVAQEKPPAQYFNWLFKNIYEWVAYLADLLTYDNTWIGKQRFVKSVDIDATDTENVPLAVTSNHPDGPAIKGTAAAGSNGIGLVGEGEGTSLGLRATGGENGAAIEAQANPSSPRGTIHLQPRVTAPINPHEGDLWIDQETTGSPRLLIRLQGVNRIVALVDP